MYLTGGILRLFWAFSTPKQNSALEVFSKTAHPQVTQNVGRFITLQEENMPFVSSGISTSGGNLPSDLQNPINQILTLLDRSVTTLA